MENHLQHVLNTVRVITRIIMTSPPPFYFTVIVTVTGVYGCNPLGSLKKKISKEQIQLISRNTTFLPRKHGSRTTTLAEDYYIAPHPLFNDLFCQ